MLAFVGSNGVHAQVQEQAIPGDPVTIESGRIVGKLLPSGVRADFGVPFVGTSRCANGVGNPRCARKVDGLRQRRSGSHLSAFMLCDDINHYFGEEATSEDGFVSRCVGANECDRKRS